MSININPAHRGLFTQKAKAAGKPVQEYANEEAHAGAVGIFLVDGQDNRLFGGLGVAPGAVRQKCVIAPSFGSIFMANCFSTGLLPVLLAEDDVKEIAAEIEQSAASRSGRLAH